MFYTIHTGEGDYLRPAPTDQKRPSKSSGGHQVYMIENNRNFAPWWITQVHRSGEKSPSESNSRTRSHEAGQQVILENRRKPAPLGPTGPAGERDSHGNWRREWIWIRTVAVRQTSGSASGCNVATSPFWGLDMAERQRLRGSRPKGRPNSWSETWISAAIPVCCPSSIAGHETCQMQVPPP